MIDLRAAFTAKVLDPYGDDLVSMHDIVTQLHTDHPDLTAADLLAWLDADGHINYLAARGCLPPDVQFTALLPLVKEALT